MVPQTFQFSPLARRVVEAQFSGGHISSDAGLLLLREIDRTIGLSSSLTKHLIDKRQSGKVQHSLHHLLQQRLYAIAAGYEDLNDHEQLRADFALQTALGRDERLASTSTLHRFEAGMDRRAIIESHRVLWHQFIASHRQPPERIVLDFDATDIPLHGDQPEKFFHGYYDHYCYLPLYVFCGRFPLVAYLRPSKLDGARHAGAILKLLVGFIRQHWPDVQIIFRGDGGFCRRRILSWCERNHVDYLVGIARNARLEALIEPLWPRVERHHATRRRQGHTDSTRWFWRYRYWAGSWHCARDVIAKAEVTDKGRNPRFIVTTLPGYDAQRYTEEYCARGEMENRIKDQQLDLFAKRTSSKHWWSNQWRLMLSMLAFVLFEKLREALSNPGYRKLGVQNLRLKFIKVAAVVTRNTRRIRFMLNENHPDRNEFIRLARTLAPG
ncbi:IS1380 family transposase [Marinobacterium zhoushanense]|uniref:IS1380 family transposase n=1 Tax=Marinobacterium zhoushanense TaxID=1679163 RepID=A0ABQ1K3Y7_9GAMM|nr:IS1380 family transposase [Marinobacterium zhoushanense]GGB87471.1 IS1380 family transposase [Marinobacterium zhoushanense]